MPSNYKTVINFRDGIQVDTDDLISNNGLVGIGSTIPRQQLDVRGNVIVDQNTELNNLKVTGVQTNYGILNVGTGYSVGIGTTIPEAAFQVGIGSTGFTVTEDGDVIGKSFTGDGSALTGIPASVWVNPGAGDTIYSIKKVGIGTTLTRGNAGFGVGYEIYMDPVSGVGTFEGVVTKNLTVTNTTGQGQGNVNADVGTFSTVTATTSVSAPSFIGTVTNAVRSVVSAGLTDSPNIDVNYIAGVGGTFTGITSFTTLQVTGGIVASAGIVTATTFSGSATTAANAAIAYGIAGDPDIQVDQLTVNGVAPSIIKGSGVSTIGQDLLVGEFLGVGNTSASAGNAAGFIGTVRVHDGDLILGGSISIGGSLVGSVELGSTQTINVLNVGAGLSVAGVTTFTGTVTGSSDFNIIGSATANELNSNDSIIAGGGITCGGGVVVGNAVAGSAINVLNGGGLILGSGITMSGSIEGATDINMNGTLSGISTIAASGEITGVTDISASGQLTGITTISMAGVGEFNGVNKITGIGSIIGSGQWHTTSMLTAGHLKSDRIDQGTSGVSTLGTANITHLNVSGGKFDFNKTSGIASATSFYSPAGLSTFSDIRVTNGGNTYMFARYIGVNTATPRITDGIEINGGVSELYVDGVGSSGIGIGSTGGQRLDDARFYVGYGRTAGGGIDNTTSIFECGNIGIGTTSVQSSSNGVETVEIYRNVRIYNNHAGVGGTVGMSTNIVQVGWNTEQPGGPLDLRAAGGPLCLPVADGDQDGAGMSYFHSDGDNIGNLWFDKYDMKLRVGMGQGSGNYIGLRTETYGKELNDWHGIRGWKGPIFTSVASRNTQTPFLPVEQAVGWSTANLGYYLPTNQFQHFASDGTWRTQVSSATTGVELIVNGTTAILNVAGIGSITLGTLS